MGAGCLPWHTLSFHQEVCVPQLAVVVAAATSIYVGSLSFSGLSRKLELVLRSEEKLLKLSCRMVDKSVAFLGSEVTRESLVRAVVKRLRYRVTSET
jgi:hypothetical protein